MNDLEKYEKRDDFRAVLGAFDNGHDDIQIEHFIVGSGLTDYGRWRQACLEVGTRYAAAKSLGFERLKAEAEIEILQAEIAGLGLTRVAAATVRLKEIEIAEKRSQIENIDRNMARTLREIEQMFKLAQFYGDRCDHADTTQNQIDYHVARLKTMALARICYPSVDGVAETAMKLPEAIGRHVLESIEAYRAGDLEKLAAIEQTKMLGAQDA